MGEDFLFFEGGEERSLKKRIFFDNLPHSHTI